MKLHSLLLISLAIISSQMSLSLEESSDSTVQQTGVNLPVIYVQNNNDSEGTLESFTVLYSYAGSNEEFSKTSSASIALPTNTLTSITSSMQISQTFEKSPEFKGVKSITVDGEVIMPSDRLVGLDPRNPIIIN